MESGVRYRYHYTCKECGERGYVESADFHGQFLTLGLKDVCPDHDSHPTPKRREYSHRIFDAGRGNNKVNWS